jgi:hypothetical protein
MLPTTLPIPEAIPLTPFPSEDAKLPNPLEKVLPIGLDEILPMPSEGME